MDDGAGPLAPFAGARPRSHQELADCSRARQLQVRRGARDRARGSCAPVGWSATLEELAQADAMLAVRQEGGGGHRGGRSGRRAQNWARTLDLGTDSHLRLTSQRYLSKSSRTVLREAGR